MHCGHKCSRETQTSATSPILLTGATGYIGGRLLHGLENAGHRVCCIARRPEALACQSKPVKER